MILVSYMYQKTSTLSRTYVPTGPDDPDKDQRGNGAVEWIDRYLEHHEGWTVLLSRQGQDGRLSFATFVRRTMASLPQSVEAEARQLRVQQSLETITEATLSFGRSKLYAIAAISLA